MKNHEVVTLKARVEGKVQGVFFRAFTCDHAKASGIEGTVKNMSDGSVEIYAKGTRMQLDQFFELLKKKPGHGSISSIQVTELSEEYSFTGFKAIH